MVTWTKVLLEGDAAELTDDVPAYVGTSSSAGVAATAARADHVHELGAGCIDASAAFAAGVVDNYCMAADSIDSDQYVDGSIDTAHLSADCVTGDKIADNAVGSEHIEVLSADLDFNGNEAASMALQNLSTAPAVPALGQLYYDTDDNHPYICTDATP